MSIAQYGLPLCSSEKQNMIMPGMGYPIREDLKCTHNVVVSPVKSKK